MNVGIEVSEPNNFLYSYYSSKMFMLLCVRSLLIPLILVWINYPLKSWFMSNNILKDNTKCQWKSCPYHNNSMYKYYYNFKKSIYLIRSRSVLVDVVNHEIDSVSIMIETDSSLRN